MAFVVAALALTLTLTSLALSSSALSDHGIRRLRSRGPRVKQMGGALLVTIGGWFAYVAITNPTYLLP